MSQGAVLFFSTHFTRIDGKGRVSFPAPFRAAMTAKNSRGVVIYSSLIDPAIEGVSVERMERMSAALEGEYEQFDRQRSLLETVIFGGSQELLIDKEGRCSLPKHFLDKAGI